MTKPKDGGPKGAEHCNRHPEGDCAFKALFEQAAIGLARLELEGSIIMANSALASMLGYAPHELEGMDIFALVHADDLGRFKAALESVRQDSDRVLVEELRLQHREGRILWTRVHLNSLMDEDGCSLKLGAQIEDVTAWHETRQALEKAKADAEAAFRAKSKFLGNMSHELRTPLNGIIGMTQLAMGGNAAPEQRQYLEVVLRASRTLLGAVNRLLELSSLDGVSPAVEAKPFALRRKLSALLDTMGEEARSKGLNFDYSFGAGVPSTLVGDKEKISHVLLNVVDNAIKFTEKGGISVGISCEADDTGSSCDGAERKEQTMLRISVKDTGKGVAPQHQEAIFEPFALEEDLLTKRYGGIGLGLAVARNLVEQMGGRIWVRSKSGQGSAFFFTCPCRPTTVQLEAEPQPQPVAPRESSALRILLVEDEPINQQVTVKMLQRSGHDVSVVEDGIKALNLLEKEPFDLVLMDIQLPRLNGLDATRSIRHGGDGALPRDISIIGLSALVGGNSREKALEAGIDEFLTKPFERTRLLQVIDETLARRGR